MSLPCTDAGSCNKYISNPNTTNVNHEESSNHQEHSEEDCPPFCGCECCTIHVLYSSSETIGDFVPAVSTEVITEYRFDFPSSVVVPIWQPPKLS